MTNRGQVIQAMRDAVAAGTWTAISGNTIRWMQELDTPEWAMKDRPLSGAYWPDPRYTRLVFVTMYAGSGDRPIVGVSPAPWIGRRDSYATLTRVAEILADPACAFEPRPTKAST